MNRTPVYYDEFYDRLVTYELVDFESFKYLVYNGGFINFVSTINKNNRLVFIGYL